MSVYDYKSVSEESVSAVTATPSVDVGTIRFHGGLEYRYMYNGGAVGYKGAPCFVTAATAGNTFVTTYATISLMTTAAGTGFGFVGTLHNATCAAASYAWVATRGMVNARPCSSAIAAGDVVMAMDGGNAVASRTGITTTATVSPGLCSFLVNTVIGQAMEAATAAATAVIKVWLR